MTITFTMHEPDEKKHSIRFNFEKFENAGDLTSEEQDRFAPSFYIPRPFASKAKKIRVTIEELT